MTKNKQLKKLAQKCGKFCCPDGRLDEKKVVSVIKNLKSLPRSQAIFAVSEFLKALKKQKAQTTLIVESSIPLPKTMLNRIVAKLKADYIISEVKNIVNPSLLGGLKIKVGDSVTDYSLRDRISKLREAITA